MISSRFMIISLVILFFSSCKTPTTPLTDTPTDLSLATKGVVIFDQHYTLSTALWRDFQPVSPPDGKPLIVFVNIVESSLGSIPADIRADSLWVIHGSQVWTSILSSEDRPSKSPHILEKKARDGPKWGPGIQVDVIVRLLDGENRIYLLKAEDQPIQRTD